MTPSDRAAEVVSHWPSKNYMDPAARPSIQKQIEKAIEQDRAAVGLTIINTIEADKELGMRTKERVVNLVMNALGIEEGTTV